MTPITMTGQYVTTSEAAKQLGISTTRVKHLIAGDRIPGAVKFGRSWFLPFTSLDKIDIKVKHRKNKKVELTNNQETP